MSKIFEELRNVAALENAAFGGNGPVSVVDSAQEQDAADTYRQAAYDLSHIDLLSAVEALQATPAPLADAELAELTALRESIGLFQFGESDFSKSYLPKYLRPYVLAACNNLPGLLARLQQATQPAPLTDATLAELAQQGTALRTKLVHHSRGGLEAYIHWFITHYPNAEQVAQEIMREAGDTLEALLDALPSLVDRVAQAEARSASLQSALESATDTNRVLVGRLQKATTVLEGYTKWEASVLEEDAAWANRAGQPWGTEALYDEWMNLQAQRNEVLRPAVKGGQPNA